jgi:LuxR family glucitol operon transcriptional activator
VTEFLPVVPSTKVVLELTTTNFVSQVRGGASGTALELSDFARSYLRRSLRIDDTERQAFIERHKHLYAVGGGLQAAHALDPYAPDTIDVRGVGYYSVAKLLRDAIELGSQAKFDEALQLCSEAAELAPGYHEVARVEAFLHESSANFGEAFESYSRAKDLAPEDPYVAFSFGNFLVNSGFDPAHGIRELQRAAKLDPDTSRLHVVIAHAFAKTQDYRQAMYAAAYAVAASGEGSEDRKDNLFCLWQNCAFGIQELARKRSGARWRKTPSSRGPLARSYLTTRSTRLRST